MRRLAPLLLALELFAQETPNIRINVNLIQVDVTVTGKKGERVSGLTPADFEVLQNGKRQTVTSALWVPGRPSVAAPPSNATVPGAPAPALKPQDVRRTIAILVDDLSLSLQSLHYTRLAVRSFVEANIEQGDLVAIYKTSAGLGILQQFTTDKRLLLANIDRITLRTFSAVDGLGAIASSSNEDSADPAIAQMALQMRLQEEAQNRIRQDILSAGSLGAAKFVVQGLAELPGRKSLVYFSENLQLYDLPASITNPNMSAAMRLNPDAQGGRRERTIAAIRDLSDYANRAAVVFYTIDPRGVVTTAFTAVDRPSVSTRRMVGQMQERQMFYDLSKDGLALLAEETGGVFYQSRNDLASALNDAVQDQEGYYLVSFNPDDDSFEKTKTGAKYHRLQVKVKRPGLKIRYRHGFLGATDEERMPKPSDPLMAAMMSPFRSADVPIRLTPMFLEGKGTGPFLRTLIHIDVRPFTFKEVPADAADENQSPWMETNIVIAAFLFGDNGTVVDNVSQAQRLRARKSVFEGFLADGVTQTLELPVAKPGAYQLRAAILSPSTQKAGSASQFVDVPNIKSKRLILSDLALYGDDFTQGKSNQSSPGIRQLRGGERFSYGAYLYNAGPAPVLQVSLYRDGKLIHRGKKEPVAAKADPETGFRAVEAAMTLGPNAPAGEYILEFAVQDPAAPKQHQFAVRTIDFTIR
jgi:VWFA-related protein